MERPANEQLGSIGHFIHGERILMPGSQMKPLFNPATGAEMGQVALGNQETVAAAVASAQEGYRVWSAYSPNERATVLRKAAQLLTERNSELARLEALNTGKPFSETQEVDILTAAEGLHYYASLIETQRSDYIELRGAFAYTRREPLGVCLGIGAWNYPLQIAAWKAAPALACGNAMIFKPSEFTPATAVKLAEILSEAGLPKGVFNVVQGDGSLAQALLADPAVVKVSLTGSIPTGKKVTAAAGAQLKHVTMELGGKSPLVIFPDAQRANAISAALLANFYSCGQVCTNGTRVFVHEDIYEDFTAELASRVAKIRQGHPLSADVNMGPLVSAAQHERVMNYIAQGQAEGARLVCGGRHPFAEEPNHPLAKGYFVSPTVFADCTDTMTIVREEIFGPVMSLLPFKTEEEVIARANATSYGLAAAVFTENLSRAHRVVAQLQAGTCWINNYNWTPVALPFGGYKESGLGRENGWEAMAHYSQLKSVYVELGDVQGPF